MVREVINCLYLTFLSVEISFQIFKISVKSGENINNALNWFSNKVKEVFTGTQINTKGIILSNSMGKVRLFLDFADVSENVSYITEMLSKGFSGEETNLHEERVTSIVSNYGQIVFQERGEIVISLITEPNDSQVEALRLIDLIFEHLEEKSFRTKDELVDFISRTLKIPKDEYREIREIYI